MGVGRMFKRSTNRPFRLLLLTILLILLNYILFYHGHGSGQHEHHTRSIWESIFNSQSSSTKNYFKSSSSSPQAVAIFGMRIPLYDSRGSDLRILEVIRGFSQNVDKVYVIADKETKDEKPKHLETLKAMSNVQLIRATQEDPISVLKNSDIPITAAVFHHWYYYFYFFLFSMLFFFLKNKSLEFRKDIYIQIDCH